MGKVSFTTKDGKRVSFSTGKKSSKKRAGPKRKSSKSKSRSKPNKQPKRSTRSVAKKGSKKGGRRSPGKKSFIDRIPILNNKTVQKVGFGLGMGVVVVELINLAARFAPPAIAQPLQQNAGIIKVATEFATEPISAIADIVLHPQMLQQITNRMGNGGQQGISGGNMVGFA